MSECKILNGDCLAVLRTLPDESVQTCVTSPPYFGLRDYGVDGQIGLESTPDAFVAKLVDVFREVRRVLKSDGTAWVNLGDSYANDTKWGGSTGGKHVSSLHGSDGNGRQKRETGLKGKDLIGIPWRVAFALQADGWWLRQDIIWNKPNPMPESVTDRCTKSHEYIFLLTKSQKYFYDGEAIKEPIAASSIARLSQDVENQNGSDRVPGKSNGTMKAVGNSSWKGSQFHTGKTAIHQLERSSTNRDRSLPRNRNGITGSLDNCEVENRNKRSVWTVTTQPYSEAHFATFPEKLIEPCILAGSRPGDTVLDPFNGAGTTGLVSLKNHRRYIGIELNQEYIEITRKRLSQVQVKLF